MRAVDTRGLGCSRRVAAPLWLLLLRGIAILVVLASAFPAASQQITGARVALVIGNGDYQSIDRLPNPANDAVLIANTLRAAGFRLVGGKAQTNLNQAQFSSVVREFGRALVGADVGLFYYAGHGLQVQGTNWLVPVDANPTRPQDLDFQMIDANLVLRQMEGAGTKLNLILLDACRNNPFLVGGVRGGQRGLAEMRAPEGTLISYATQPGNVAADGSGANSPYTVALVEGMKQPGLDIFRLFNRVGLDVKRRTAGSQQPWVSTSPIDGEFQFTGGGPALAPVPAPNPAPVPAAVPAPAAPVGPPEPAASSPPFQTAGVARPPPVPAPLPAGPVREIGVGINLSFTGADAESAERMSNGALLAFEEANADRTGGYSFKVVRYDDGTAAAGQYDPAKAAANARAMVAQSAIIAAVGPQMSGAAKAMAPILSQGNLAIITPSSTNPDLTDPRYAAQYRPAGRPIYFRTISTDAHQGPGMANFMADRLSVRSVYVLDDGGAYGVGIADAFQGQAELRGIRIVGRSRLDPKAADYSVILAKIKASEAQAFYYGGVSQAGAKLARQSYEVIPNLVKAGGDGMQSSDVLAAAGFPAIENWYVSVSGAHVVDGPRAGRFVARYRARFKGMPDDYSVSAYVAAQVIIQAVRQVGGSGGRVTRDSVRDAIQSTRLGDSLIGPVAFDANGDVTERVISIFKVVRNSARPLDDPDAQYRYIGAAPF